jgi:TetR/AcrR family transcriptional repressor of nem operon
MSTELGTTGRKIVQKAQHLLQERGFQFFSFQDLADFAGIRKASVFHYFKTKEELARWMIVDYRERMESWARDLAAKTSDPREKLAAYFQMFANISKNGRNVCPGGSLLLDWNNFSKPVQAELQELLKFHRRWLTQLLEEALAKKILNVKAEQIPSHSLLIGSSLQGGLQVARANPDPEKVLTHLFRQIERVTFRTEDV